MRRIREWRLASGVRRADASGGAAALIEAAQAEITVEAMDVELDSIVQYDRLSGRPGRDRRGELPGEDAGGRGDPGESGHLPGLHQ